jgi:oxygen-independent coproporphyrinogen-3 oxidase
MAANGYEQYEISAFAKLGFRCRHNLNYWTFGDYLAAGAGAHGKFTDNEGKIWRYTKPRHPLSYIEQVERRCIDNMEREVSIADIGFEFMLNALRLPEGFTASDYIARTGLSLDPLREGLELAQAKGMIESIDGPGWRPTAFGLRFLNDLTAIFLV